MLANTLLLICFIVLTFFVLFAYLKYGPGRFQARVPRTNMAGVERAVGKPLFIGTNSDGAVQWDYTRWWLGRARVYFDTNGHYTRTFTDW